MTLLSTALAMDPLTIAAFMAAAVVLYLTPGADMMITVASGIAGGPRAGIAAAAGISLGVLAHTLIAAAGLAAVLAATPAAFDAIRLGGGAYLAWLAYAAWTAPPASGPGRGHGTIARAFRRGFLTNILNPKVALFVLAFLPQFVTPGAGPITEQIIALGLLLTIGGFFADATYGVAAAALARRLTSSGRTMNRIAAVVFAGLAARIVSQ